MDLLKEQLWLEEEGHLEAKAKYLSRYGEQGEGIVNTMGDSLISVCAPVLADLYENWLQIKVPGKGAKNKKWYRELQVKPIGVAVVALRTMLQRAAYEEKPPTLTSVATSLFQALYIEDSYQKVRSVNKGNMVAGSESIAKNKFNKKLETELSTSVTFYKRKKLIEYARDIYTDFEGINSDERFSKGVQMVDMCLKMQVPVSAEKGKLSYLFELRSDYRNRKTIHLTDDLKRYMEAYKNYKAGNIVDLKPMVIPPLPWSGIFGGGYRTLKCQLKMGLIRSSKTKIYKDTDIGPSIYKAVNIIQAVPWSINKKVYAVMRYCYDNQFQVAGLPVKPPEPVDYKRYTDEEWSLLSSEEKKAYRALKHKKYKEAQSTMSKVRAFGSKMVMCKAFIKYDKIYFPHSFDFRGRIYPVGVPVNPQSDKYGQALLHFHNKKKLGKTGAFWWKVHGANCFGKDKAPYEERVAWVDENKDWIIEVAKEPLKLREEWSDLDDPWNFLAFALEYQEMHSKGIPEEDYESSLPIKLDATSSGLQHYSAIFRDDKGALATNLTADKDRQDIYGLVAQRAKEYAEELLSRMPAEGHKTTNGILLSKQILRQLLNKLDRSTCKPATMCLPYGITDYGAITDVIELATEGKLGEYLRELSDRNLLYQYCAWVTRCILKGVEKTVTSAVVGMDWLKDAEKAIQKVNNDDTFIRYTTRLGFPSMQTYTKIQIKRIKTSLGTQKYKCNVGIQTPFVDKGKSQSSIAPNYIHSMDATHLLMTALKAYDKLGIEDFCFIHDSFGVHACDTEEFGKVIRETFVSLYKGDTLEKLRDQWVDQFPDAEIPPVPKGTYGNFDINEVVKSLYFFS